ncbi:MAG TPA: DNA-directed RNA polymerase subunit H [Candidatus Bathyarchaeota archaeon]|nr:DNA-directed RNA polymerase subunit H [Candidatus Bathyarchaeota archaeon]
MTVEEEPLEERKAKVLIKLRKYKLLERVERENTVEYLVEVPKEKRKILIWCVPSSGTIGVQFVNRLKKLMKEREVENAIMITNGRFTQAAKSNARKKGIELLSRAFPAFNIFKHVLVPKHEILTPKEREELLQKYRVKPYQLPAIKASDPAVKAIGAKPGDILRIIRDSPTAGKYVAYRYVIEG